MSCKIVPTATYYLFQSIATWTLVEHITLTNLSFPSDSLDLHGPLVRNAPLLPPLQHLRTLYLGQATLLPASAIAAMALQDVRADGKEYRGCLEQIRLVDAYQESIWGRRLRRADIEKAALASPMLRDLGAEVVLERIRNVVTCEAMNERIMGGDRSEGLTLLG